MAPSPLKLMAEQLPTMSGANLRLASWYLDTFGSGSPLPLEHNSNAVAKAVGVSRATVIRFTRLLGYSGFSAFRNALFQYSSESGRPLQADLPNKDAAEGLCTVIATHVAALEESLQHIDMRSFCKAVTWLENAKSILWIGWGDSYFVAASGEHKCRLGGLVARSANDFSDLNLSISGLVAGDVVVAVSQSGRWQPIIEAIRAAQEQGIYVICLTGHASSELAKIANITFITVNPTYRVAGHPFTLRSAQLALIDALILETVRVTGKHAIVAPGA